MEALIGISVVIVVLIAVVVGLIQGRGTGGTTVIVDNIAIGLNGGELQAVIRGMTPQEEATFYRAEESDQASVAAGEAFVNAVRRWLRANPKKAAQKGYPLV